MATGEAPITRSDLREEFRLLRNEFARLYATKADLGDLEVRLTKEMTVQLRWMVSIQLLGLGVVAAIVKLL